MVAPAEVYLAISGQQERVLFEPEEFKLAAHPQQAPLGSRCYS